MGEESIFIYFFFSSFLREITLDVQKIYFFVSFFFFFKNFHSFTFMVVHSAPICNSPPTLKTSLITFRKISLGHQCSVLIFNPGKFSGGPKK